MLAIIKNGYKADKKHVVCKLTTDITRILIFFLDRGYINGFSLDKSQRLTEVYLKYSRFGSPISFYFNHIQVLPKFSYLSVKRLRRFYFHSYICVLSTNMGLLTGDKAVFFCRGGLYLFKL